MKRLLLAASVALALGACNEQGSMSRRSQVPVPPQTVALMATKGVTQSDPMLVRLYKKESELEVWKRGVDGEYAHLKTFPICRWSGQLGPKRREGDRQAPEGFYSITPGLMNPNSSYYLSFDTGFPNAYDRAHGGTGSHLMVHGSCSSRGCYAMTDEGIAEVYALAREAFAGGQKAFQLQAYPFRMTAENLAKFRNDPNMPFWKNLKEGSDTFEITRRETKVAVCGNRYAFNTVDGACTPEPEVAAAVAEKDAKDRQEVAELVAKGTRPVRLVYADGGQHESFRNTALASLSGDSGFAILDARSRRNLGEVSRPEALAQGPTEIAMDEPAATSPGRASVVRVAAAAPAKKNISLAVASASTGPAQGSRGTNGPVLLAKAEEPAPAPARAGAPESRPFYERVIGDVFGRSSEAAPKSAAAEPAPPAALAPPPRVSVSPLPPRRKSVSAAPPAAAKPGAAGLPGAAPTSPKPQADLPVRKRHVDASALLGGAGSGTPAFARN